jgi:hypothetical protein
MDETSPKTVSHLFLLRVWLDQGADEAAGGAHDWHGKVQHVITGRASSFTSLTSMAQLLTSMLAMEHRAVHLDREGQQTGTKE